MEDNNQDLDRRNAIFVQTALNSFVFGSIFGQFTAIREIFSMKLNRPQSFKHVLKTNFAYGFAFAGIGVFIKFIELQKK